MKHSLIIVVFLCFQSLFSQAISGKVYDMKTGNIIEGAFVYFDRSSIGKITDQQGYFSIEPQLNSNTPLVISHIGYETLVIEYSKLGEYLEIGMKEEFFKLSEVVLLSDPFTRKQKLEVFRKEFLGESVGGENSAILNEDALTLPFNSSTNTLSAYTSEPLVIINDYLGYNIRFDLLDFKINFKTKSLKRIDNIKSTFIYGHTFFTDLSIKEERFASRRNMVFKGSVQHFMQTIWNQSWLEESFKLRSYDQKQIEISDAFEVSAGSNIFSKKVNFKLNKFKIAFKRGIFKNWSSLTLISGNSIIIDKYGSYSPYQLLEFGGEMADHRIGDVLPLDFEVNQIFN